MAYTKQTWSNGSAGGTPLTAARLQHMENGIGVANNDTITRPQVTQGVVVEVANLQPVTVGNEPFQFHYNSFPGSGAAVGTYNHGAFLGWNAGRHSAGTVVNNKPCILMGFEDNYFDNDGDLFYGTEWYVEHWSPDGTSTQMLRPFYARCENSNTAKNATIFHEVGTDNKGSWQVRTAVGAPLIYVNSAGASITPTLTLSALAVGVGMRGNVGANKDLYFQPGTATGSILFQDSAGSFNNIQLSNSGDISLRDGMTINNFGATGMKLLGSATQKLGFFGQAPTARPTGTPAAATDLASVITLANDLRAKLITLGLIS